MVPYLVSLALPAVTGSIDAPNTTAPGIQALMMGWVVSPIVWLANVFLLIGLCLFLIGRLAWATATSAAAAVCAALLLADPMGLRLEIGYYVWLSSMLVFLVESSLYSYRRHRA